MPTTRKHEEHDPPSQPVSRAAIYLCEFGTDEPDPLRNVPTINQQRALCRQTATAINAQVIGEFVDNQRFWQPSRQGLCQVLEMAGQRPRLDYLIVSSWDRLGGDCYETIELAWHLGSAGTVVVSADAEHAPCIGEIPPSRS
jgi:DNA invertase Pin-like site-specific DNA recombinase